MTNKRYKVDWMISGVGRAYPCSTQPERMRFINAFLEFRILHPAWEVGPDCAMPGTQDFLNAASGLFQSGVPDLTEEIALKRIRELMIYLTVIQTNRRFPQGPTQ